MKSFFEKIIDKYYWGFFVLAAAVTAFLCFRCLGIKTIDSWDEARHGISAYEMMQSGNYLVNTFCGQADYWNVKPPLSFLSIVVGFRLFGYTTTGLRAVSAFCYLLTVICTGLFAKKYGKLCSLLTMLFLAANYFPFKAHLVRSGDADSLYLLLFTLAMLAMLSIQNHPRWLYVCGLCFSLAFLTKSFHAGMIAAIGGLFLLLTKEIRQIRSKGWGIFLGCSLFPILLWAVLRFQYDGTTFFQNMYEADLAGRTAAGGLEGHGFPFTFYLTSIFWNFDYIYGGLTLAVLAGLAACCFLAVRKRELFIGKEDLIGLLLWLFVPLLGFSMVSTKLMWYVYPCIVPLCLLAAIFLSRLLTTEKLPTWLRTPGLLLLLCGTAYFLWGNYLDNVRGARSNDLQTFIIENFDRADDRTGSTVYLDAYDPFLYANTTDWEQNMRLLAMLEGDLDCQDGGIEAFEDAPSDSLLILSVPFLADHPELETYEVLADNGEYLLLRK
jgi:4-amino-4-deoxy-L-arabinose transferase-like glycosyltransferase